MKVGIGLEEGLGLDQCAQKRLFHIGVIERISEREGGGGHLEQLACESTITRVFILCYVGNGGDVVGDDDNWQGNGSPGTPPRMQSVCPRWLRRQSGRARPWRRLEGGSRGTAHSPADAVWMLLMMLMRMRALRGVVWR